MALKRYNVGTAGLDVAGVAIVTGPDAPDGSGSSADLPIGSLYIDATAGSMYQKTGVGNTAGDFAVVGSVESSWLLPVRAMSSSLTSLPTTSSFDGLTLSSGDKILLTNVALESAMGIYEWDGTDYTQIIAMPTYDGSTVYVYDGTHAKEIWGYAFDSWANVSDTESGFIRLFIGKSSKGSGTPDYSSVNYISDGQSLVAALSTLDGTVFGLQDELTYFEGVVDQLLLPTIDAATATTAAVTSSFGTDALAGATFKVQVRGTGANLGRIEHFNVTVIHDGTDSSDASNVVHTIYGETSIGTSMAVTVTASLSGTNPDQEVTLSVTPPFECDVRIERYPIVHHS